MKTAYFNRFTVDMPAEAVNQCSHHGACDDDVDFWQDRIAINAPPDQIRAELKEYGAWTQEELNDNQANKRRLLWLAAGNIQEDELLRAEERNCP